MDDPVQDTLNKFDELIFGKRSSEIAGLEQGTSARRRYKGPLAEKSKPTFQKQGTAYTAKYRKEKSDRLLEIAETRESFEKNIICGPTRHKQPVSYSDYVKQKLKCYEQYNFRHNEPSPLPIDKKKEEILEILKKEDTIIIKGFTGCGKTTRVPQFILDQCHQLKQPCNIVVTQPRRLAATSVAARVCQERGWVLGTVVGYAVGMESKTNAYTCLTYMTTGCLLERLVSSKSLGDYTHLIVDEIHERDEDTDLLLMIIQKLTLEKDSNVKVIMMSATANAETFAQYFERYVQKVKVQATVVSVDSAEAIHPVKTFYLDDVPRLLPGRSHSKRDERKIPHISSDMYTLAADLISSLDKSEIKRFGRHPHHGNISSARGAVLVFLPGIYEIGMMQRALTKHDQVAPKEKKNFWYILPLHSRITSDEQRRVFLKPPNEKVYHRKIVLSTNIAESSLTLPDVRYIVDFCLVKLRDIDKETGLCTLKLHWASKSSCTQRKGRVGRIREGIVYRMVYKDFFDKDLPNDTPPEIKRCPLENTVLRLKTLDLGPPKALLASLIDPPECQNIVQTIRTLQEMGALFVTANGKVSDEDGDLSFLGRVLARLPIDVRLGKLIMLGYIFNVFEESVIMAAGLSSKNIFVFPPKKIAAYQAKMRWDNGAFSDPIAILNVYQAWKRKHLNSEFNSYTLEKKWTSENFIDLKALKEMDALVNELKFRLDQKGIKEVHINRPLLPSEKMLLYYTIIYGAFYPQYFSRCSHNPTEDEANAVKSLGGMSPHSTVRLQGFPKDQPFRPYLKQIREGLKDVLEISNGWDARIKVDEQRVLVQFHQEDKTGEMNRVCLPVYFAVKQRLIGHKYSLKMMDRRKAEMFSRQVEEDGKMLLSLSDSASVASSNLSLTIHLPDPRTPKINEYLLDVTVSHIETPDRFWCQRMDDESKSDYKQINRIINQRFNLRPLNSESVLRKGHVVMGPYQAGVNCPVEYFRAKVLSVQQGVPIKERRVKLIFIDFGNAAEVLVDQLMLMPNELIAFAPLAFECCFAGIGPNWIIDPLGKWSPAANELLASGLDRRLKAKVYSVVDGVTALDLVESENWEESFAKQMVERGYAVRLEESYLSKANHEERQIPTSSRCLENHRLERLRERQSEAEAIIIEENIQEICTIGKCALKGPCSPLEMSMYSKLRGFEGCTAAVGHDSVNSVLLDNNPGYRNERLLVACYVSPNRKYEALKARNTTLLPCIPGLPSVLALIFCPRAELLTDKERKILTGALCGLGFRPGSNRPLYNSHDMEVVFDVKINAEDILEINKIRYWLNSFLGRSAYTNQNPDAPPVEMIREIQCKLLKSLFNLIKIPRCALPAQGSSEPKWNQTSEEYLIRSEENQFECLFPLLNWVSLAH